MSKFQRTLDALLMIVISGSNYKMVKIRSLFGTANILYALRIALMEQIEFAFFLV